MTSFRADRLEYFHHGQEFDVMQNVVCCAQPNTVQESAVRLRCLNCDTINVVTDAAWEYRGVRGGKFEGNRVQVWKKKRA